MNGKRHKSFQSAGAIVEEDTESDIFGCKIANLPLPDFCPGSRLAIKALPESSGILHREKLGKVVICQKPDWRRPPLLTLLTLYYSVSEGLALQTHEQNGLTVPEELRATSVSVIPAPTPSPWAMLPDASGAAALWPRGRLARPAARSCATKPPLGQSLSTSLELHPWHPRPTARCSVYRRHCRKFY